jgi:hypothetical protein
MEVEVKSVIFKGSEDTTAAAILAGLLCEDFEISSRHVIGDLEIIILER